MTLRRIILLSAIVLAAVYFGFSQPKSVALHNLVETSQNRVETNRDLVETSQNRDDTLASAFNNRTNNLQVEGKGTVIKLLPDDLAGIRHQRFIIRLSSGQTLLIAHNIDLAGRIISLRKGDKIFFYGQYEWNSKGGTIHWTHHDPAGRHTAGWIEHNGKRYQ
jgi:hypothetical protein